MSLSDLDGRGWVVVEPPLPEDGESVVARLNGDAIKAGFLMERISDEDDLLHVKYRSGRYNLEVKVDFEIGRGQVKVERAEGYSDN